MKNNSVLAVIAVLLGYLLLRNKTAKTANEQLKSIWSYLDPSAPAYVYRGGTYLIITKDTTAIKNGETVSLKVIQDCTLKYGSFTKKLTGGVYNTFVWGKKD